ncbi:MAG: argininosuccinate lyase [Candidatus Rokubacteria bacterium]|nr:argininosuccinate lyase [Candidatus Rokubacteria bacterium]
MTATPPPGAPWGGRFVQPTDPAVRAFTASLPFDHRLWPYDLEGSEAWARALAKGGVLTEAELEVLLKGLAAIREELERGAFPFRPELEDIHMNIERRLQEKVGEVGGKLHTGRSRNDQVALDMRLYLRAEIRAIRQAIRDCQAALVAQAETHPDAPMPGYTHLQRAQPILLAHHLLAYVFMLERDRERYRDCLGRVERLPLGAGALAGTTVPVDRHELARGLGFALPAPNSVDAVSDRDFALEFLGTSAILAMHLSRLGEELVLWASQEFGFVELPDAFATGSSLMPQKKNPDVAELIRAKAGRVYGDLVALLTVMKGLPLAYQRDMQEDKEAFFDAADTVKASLGVLAPFLRALVFRTDRLRAAAGEGYTTATDLADYLVRRGTPFRQAHELTGRIVRYAIEQGRPLAGLTLEELRRFSPLVGPDVHQALTVEASLAAREVYGGTGPEAVRRALAEARALLEAP